MRSLVLSAIFIALVAASVPGLFTQYMQKGPRPSERRHAAREVIDVGAPELQPDAAGREVRIRAERDGHFYVEADINFRPVRLIVDTGATVVALRESDAITAGVRVRDADFVSPVQTANGTTQAAEVTLDSVTVQDIEVRHVRALVIHDDQLSVSLLGGSFLHGLHRFEVADGTLVFEN